MDRLAFLDATAQADLVRRREVSSLELTESAVERIERLNPAVGAVVMRLYEQARATAGGPLAEGPFAGVPCLVSDLALACAGVPLTAGSAFRKGFVPRFDSVLTARLRQAGAVIPGKTGTAEFGLLPTAESHLYGLCRNPWDAGRSAGGSGGGAAVAAGLAPVALDGDWTGLVGVSAACCGLFGLKPTRGRTTLAAGGDGALNGLSAVHAVTRSVRDSAALLDVLAGPAPGDPCVAPPPLRPFRQEVGADPGVLRIAFTLDTPTGARVHPDCAAAVRAAAALCSSLGHKVEEAGPYIEGEAYLHALRQVWAAGCAWQIEDAACGSGRPPAPDRFEPCTWALYQQGRALPAPEYLLAVAALQHMCRQVAAFLDGYDVWLTPVMTGPPPPLGSFAAGLEDALPPLARAQALCPFLPLIHLTGQPAMSVPLHWNTAGLPIGTLFTGRYGEEAILLRLAAQLEAARPWANRRPPLHA